jgi:hypothetical protein
MLRVVALGCLIAAVLSCTLPPVALPNQTATATDGKCPGTAAAVDSVGPFQYELPASTRFEYAYVKTESVCTLVVLNQTSTCYRLRVKNTTYTLTTTGSPSCKIGKVFFYSSFCPECFDADSILNVKAENGTILPTRADMVRKGDFVETFGEHGTYFEKVLHAYDHHSKPTVVLHIHFQNTVNGEKGFIGVTRNHMLPVSKTKLFSDRKATAAKYATPGMFLFGRNAHALEITHVTTKLNRVIMFYTWSDNIVVDNVYAHAYNFGQTWSYVESWAHKAMDLIFPNSKEPVPGSTTFTEPFENHVMPIVESIFDFFY